MRRGRQARIDDPAHLVEEICFEHGGVRRIRHRQIFIGDKGRVFITTRSGSGEVLAKGRGLLNVRSSGRAGTTFRLEMRLTPLARERLRAAGEYLTSAEVTYIPAAAADAKTITIYLHYKSCRGKRAVRRRKGR